LLPAQNFYKNPLPSNVHLLFLKTLNVRLADQFGLAVVRLIAPMTFSPAGLSFVLTGYSEQPSSEADADPTHEYQKSNCENAVHLTSLSHSNHFSEMRRSRGID
jgi:hypothetical protein